MPQSSRPILIRPATGMPHREPRGRLLLLSYHFPPGQSAGALRWQKMVEHISDAGWEVDVITSAPATPLDEAAMGELDQLPPRVRVFALEDTKSMVDEFVSPLVASVNWVRALIKTRTSDPSTLPQSKPVTVNERAHPKSIAARDVTWRPFHRSPRRAFFAVYRLATEGTWAANAGILARRLIRGSDGYQILVTSGPPHLVHFTAARIAIEYDIPHVLDLRDPWRFVERFHEPVASPVWNYISAIAENWSIRGARLILANTPASARRLRQAYPHSSERIISVPNGCDTVFPKHESPRRDPFTVLFAGSIYLDRDPVPFFRGVAGAIRSLDVSPSEFKVVFVGHVGFFEGIPTTELAREYGISDYLELVPFESRERLGERLYDAHVLLSLPQDSDMAVPSKIYEYMGYPTWLMVMADPGSATWELLDGTGADLIPDRNPEEIARILERRFEQYRRGELPLPLANSSRVSRADYIRPFMEFLESHAIAGKQSREH